MPMTVEVCGQRFLVPNSRFKEFEFWLGTNNPFGRPMDATDGNCILHQEDFGGCGSNATRTVRIPVETFMMDKCQAPLILGECEFCGSPATRKEFFDTEVLVCAECSANQ